MQIALDTGKQPLKQQDREHCLKPIQHMMAGFKNYDPPTEKKLACHPDLPDFACTNAYRGILLVLHQVTGNLVCIAFYYLF